MKPWYPAPKAQPLSHSCPRLAGAAVELGPGRVPCEGPSGHGIVTQTEESPAGTPSL